MMSTASSPPTPQQQQMLHYLEHHAISERMNMLINRLVREQPNDPWSWMVKETKARAGKAVCEKITSRPILDHNGNPTYAISLHIHQHQQTYIIATVTISGCVDGDVDVITQSIKGQDPLQQISCDERLSTIPSPLSLPTSVTFTLAASHLTSIPIHQHLSSHYNTQSSLARLMVSMISSTRTSGEMRIAEVGIVVKAAPVATQMRIITSIYQQLSKSLAKKKALIHQHPSGTYTSSDITTIDDGLRALSDATHHAGHVVGTDVTFYVHINADVCWNEGKYEVEKGKSLSTSDLCTFFTKLRRDHPHASTLIDPFHSSDDDGWARGMDVLKDVMIVGEGLVKSGKERLTQVLQKKLCDGVIYHVDRATTVTDAIRTIQNITAAGLQPILSHTSGEQMGSFMADLAAAISAPLMKLSPPLRSPSVATLNRLSEIESELSQPIVSSSIIA